MSGFVWMSSSGCLLPFLIIFNLFFGKLIFNSTRLWLCIEVVLILIFMLKINIMLHKITRQFKPRGRGLASNSQSHRPEGRGWQPNNPSHKTKGKIIDVQGQEVEEKKS